MISVNNILIWLILILKIIKKIDSGENNFNKLIKEYHNQLYIKVLINRKILNAIIDSGSVKSVIDIKLAEDEKNNNNIF